MAPPVSGQAADNEKNDNDNEDDEEEEERSSTDLDAADDADDESSSSSSSLSVPRGQVITEVLPAPSPARTTAAASNIASGRPTTPTTASKRVRMLSDRGLRLVKQLSASHLELRDTVPPLESDHVWWDSSSHSLHNTTNSSNTNANATNERSRRTRQASFDAGRTARSHIAKKRPAHQRSPRANRHSLFGGAKGSLSSLATIRMPAAYEDSDRYSSTMSPPASPSSERGGLLPPSPVMNSGGSSSGNHATFHDSSSSAAAQHALVDHLSPPPLTTTTTTRRNTAANRTTRSPRNTNKNNGHPSPSNYQQHFSQQQQQYQQQSPPNPGPPQERIQYRLKSKESKFGGGGVTDENFSTQPTGISRWLKWGSIYEQQNDFQSWSSSSNENACCCCGINQLVMRYLHWTFRSSFGMVFLSACLGFLCFTMLFAVLILILGKQHPECVGGVGGESGTEHNWFMDSFVLSWTTFSTVGYGLVYSGISAEVTNIKRCTALTIVVTLEAFVGVLFAGMCGAIIYAKVSRIQSFAQVLFSDPIVIRYGAGVLVENEKVEGIGSDEEDDSQDGAGGDVEEGAGHPNSRIPCPVLEFRIVNRMSAVSGGEILDAVVSIVASIDASQACPTVRSATRVRRRRKGRKRPMPSHRPKSATTQQTHLHHRLAMQSLTGSSIRGSSINGNHHGRGGALGGLQSSNMPSRSLGNKTHQAFEEDPTGHLVPRRIFSKLHVDSQEHPFFKRSWMIRHILDEHSPLLSADARQKVQANHGFWPKELNSASGVRSAVLFDQILVSLSGTSNADAHSVYSQHIYYFCDVNVGYRFVNVLYRDLIDGSLRVDNRLISDVTVQAGGGGEPLSRVQGPDTIADMLVL